MCFYYFQANSFHDGFSPAIGLFGASGIRVQDTVSYKTVSGGMIVYGDDHVIERNLMAYNIWEGGYESRYETKNLNYDAAFNLVKAGTIVFKDNIVS